MIEVEQTLDRGIDARQIGELKLRAEQQLRSPRLIACTLSSERKPSKNASRSIPVDTPALIKA